MIAKLRAMPVSRVHLPNSYQTQQVTVRYWHFADINPNADTCLLLGVKRTSP